jgi:hypothetical protein
VTKALTDLPCVDPSSVKVDITTKLARFKPNKDAKVDIEEVKQAIGGVAGGRYSVTKVEEPKKK